MAGPVDLLFGGKTLGAKGLYVVFDSGSTYTYLNPQAYQTTLALASCSSFVSVKEVQFQK